MAKSLRSKWRRKCRAVKRIRYGEKELARLKKTLGIDENAPVDNEMKDIEEIAIVTDAESIKKNIKDKQDAEVEEEEEEKVEMMDDGTGRIFNKNTMKDQHGNYPIWMNRRKVAKLKKGKSKNKKATTQKDQHGNCPASKNPGKIVKHKKGRAKNQKATTKRDKKVTRKEKNKHTKSKMEM